MRAFNVDFNWFQGKAAPGGMFVNADVPRLMDWYADLGADTVWTFGMTYNGYCWYSSRTAPKNPGLSGDFVEESLREGEKRGLAVWAYVCAGSNPAFLETHPGHRRPGGAELINTVPDAAYRDFFCGVLRELSAYPLAGVVIDWLRPPLQTRERFCDREKALYAAVMGERFPEPMPGPEELLRYEQTTLRIWFSEIQQALGGMPVWTNHPFQKGEDALWRGCEWLSQVRYILNEAPEPALMDMVRAVCGENLPLVQNLCGWENCDLETLRFDHGADVFGFAAADPATGLPTPEISAANWKNIERIRRLYRGLREG